MKLRITAALIAAVSIGFAQSPVHAAGTPTPPSSAAAKNPNWLGLTPEQQKKMNARYVKYQQDMMALRSDQTTPAKDKIEKAQALKSAFEADMDAMLTPKQRAIEEDKKRQFLASPQGKAFIKQQEAARLQMRQIIELRDKLVKSLTPDQKQKIQTLQMSDAQALQALSSDSTMSNDAKNAKAEELHKDSMTKMDAILSPDQRAEFDKLQTMMPTPPPGGGQ